MIRNGKKRYRFSDEILSTDTKITLTMGILSLLVTAGCMIYSIVKDGNIGEQVGYILLAGGVLALTGVIFGFISLRSADGGVISKRTSIIVSLAALAVIVVTAVL